MSVQSLLLSILSVVLFVWCALPRSTPGRSSRNAARRRRQEERQAQRRSHRTGGGTEEERMRNRRMQDSQYRESVVSQCLWIQQVIKEEGQKLTLGPPGATSSEGSGRSVGSGGGDNCSIGHGSDSNGDGVSTCVICLEPFRVGDVLAWSRGTQSATTTTTSGTTTSTGATTPPSGEATTLAEDTTTTTSPNTASNRTVALGHEILCKHVFHKECIHSWLLNPKHDDCPSCRITIVREPPKTCNGVGSNNDDDDDDDERTTNIGLTGFEEDDDLEDGGLSGAAFVVVHGLVSRVRRASYSMIGSNVVQAKMGDEEEGSDMNDDECFEDEPSSSLMEMGPPQTSLSHSRHSVVEVPPAHLMPVASPLRQVSSHTSVDGRPRRRPLRRRSFGSIKSIGNEGILHSNYKTLPSNVALPTTFPMRRTLSAGTLVRGTSEGSASGSGVSSGRVQLHESSLILSPGPSGANKLLPLSLKPSTGRPIWSQAAERALSQSLDDWVPHDRSSHSPSGGRLVVALPPTTPFLGVTAAASSLGREVNKGPGRRKSGYSLLPSTTSAQRATATRHSSDNG